MILSDSMFQFYKKSFTSAIIRHQTIIFYRIKVFRLKTVNFIQKFSIQFNDQFIDIKIKKNTNLLLN